MVEEGGVKWFSMTMCSLRLCTGCVLSTEFCIEEYVLLVEGEVGRGRRESL